MKRKWKFTECYICKKEIKEGEEFQRYFFDNEMIGPHTHPVCSPECNAKLMERFGVPSCNPEVKAKMLEMLGLAVAEDLLRGALSEEAGSPRETRGNHDAPLGAGHGLSVEPINADLATPFSVDLIHILVQTIPRLVSQTNRSVKEEDEYKESNCSESDR